MAHRNEPVRMALAAIAVLVTAALPLAALPVFSVTVAAAARFVARTEPPFATLAEEILAGLDASAAARERGNGPRVAGPRIAIWPFSPLETPIPSALANEYNAKLLAALIDAQGFARRRRTKLVVLASPALRRFVEICRLKVVLSDLFASPGS